MRKNALQHKMLLHTMSKWNAYFNARELYGRDDETTRRLWIEYGAMETLYTETTGRDFYADMLDEEMNRIKF